MDDAASGFRIGEAFHAWGTLFDAVAPGKVRRGYAAARLPCPSVWSLPTVYAEPTAPRPDRPVTSVAYELAEGGRPARYLLADLVFRLGQPDEIERSDLPEHGQACDSVVLHARWARAPAAFSLSLYGAARPSDFGPGLGKLYLSWTDMDAAAAPFLAQWHAANDAAAAAAATAAPRLFPLQYPIRDAGIPLAEATRLALWTPELLQTPRTIADRVGKRSFGLWNDGPSARWYLSSLYSTVGLGGPETSRAQFLEIAPAKGGGFSALEVGPWSLRDAYRARGIGEAVDALRTLLPDITIEHHTGHDV
ncbi:MAG: hypothetical protein ACOY4R_06260 [Pseudomonadota bacterium]